MKKRKRNNMRKIGALLVIAVVFCTVLFTSKHSISKDKRFDSEKISAYNNTYTQTDNTQGSYNIVYEYMDTDNDLKYDTCKVTIMNIFTGLVPSDWNEVEANGDEISIYKNYNENVTNSVINLGRGENVSITVDKIGQTLFGLDIPEGTDISNKVLGPYNITYEYIYTM